MDSLMVVSTGDAIQAFGTGYGVVVFCAVISIPLATAVEFLNRTLR